MFPYPNPKQLSPQTMGLPYSRPATTLPGNAGAAFHAVISSELWILNALPRCHLVDHPGQRPKIIRLRVAAVLMPELNSE
jgi:hypothetical protein